MADAKKYITNLPEGTPTTPRHRIRRMNSTINSKSSNEKPKEPESQSQQTPKEEKHTAAKSRPKPKAAAGAGKKESKPKAASKPKPQPKATLKAKAKPKAAKGRAKGLLKVSKAHTKRKQRSGHSAKAKEEGGKGSKPKAVAAREPATRSKSDAAKDAEEKVAAKGTGPKSPGAEKRAKAVHDCLRRADTRDMASAPASKKPKSSKADHHDHDVPSGGDSSEDEDARMEEVLRLKREQHARYMRFSRSCKSQRLIHMFNFVQKLLKHVKPCWPLAHAFKRVV